MPVSGSPLGAAFSPVACCADVLAIRLDEVRYRYMIAAKHAYGRCPNLQNKAVPDLDRMVWQKRSPPMYAQAVGMETWQR